MCWALNRDGIEPGRADLQGERIAEMSNEMQTDGSEQMSKRNALRRYPMNGKSHESMRKEQNGKR